MTALIDRFRDVLPVSETTPVVSLGEGSTPLLHLPRLSGRYGVELWAKWEAANPTASYKDRGMTVAVSKALEEGVGRGDLRLDGEHRSQRSRVRRPRRVAGASC